jgi:hypothetical protein
MKLERSGVFCENLVLSGVETLATSGCEDYPAGLPQAVQSVRPGERGVQFLLL